MKDIVVEQEHRGYVIRVEADHSVIHSRLYGFFDVDFETQYYNDYCQVLDAFPHSKLYLLVDTRAYPPQSKAVQEIRQKLFQKLSGYPVVKIAYLVEQVLSRLQSERLSRDASRFQAAFFKSEDEARAWLLE